MKFKNNSLFIFRRDLRLNDNIGLMYALSNSDNVIPIFILDTNLLKNRNISKNATQFLKESLIDLSNQLKEKNGELFILKDKPFEIIKKLIDNTELNITSVIFNRDYTPYANLRDSKIINICKNKKKNVIQFSDLLLNEPELVLKNDGNPYKVFTPYYRNAIQIPVKDPNKNNYNNYFQDSIKMNLSDLNDENLNYYNEKIKINGGTTEAYKILKNITRYKNYIEERDYPGINGTTRLSAHLKFGTISIREAYYHIKGELNNTLLRQLYWRDFYIHIGYFFPHVFSSPFKQKYNNLDWSYDKEIFEMWCMGKTGFPIVDAGMRELNNTGFMHNRIRMIVASFLTKDLLIDWKWGEKYFASKLVDFDISLNNGNWQWASSTGTDAQPYFRIFNPWLQQKKFDKECKYIKKYVPELSNLSPKEIHNLFKRRPEKLSNYPKPIVDHSKVRKSAIAMFNTL